MKLVRNFFIVVVAVAAILLLTACGSKTCHYCNEAIEGDAVEAGGRTYCSYDHYMNELVFGG